MKTLLLIVCSISLAAGLAARQPRGPAQRPESAVRIEEACAPDKQDVAAYAFCLRYKAYEAGLYRPLSPLTPCDAQLDICAGRPGASYEKCKAECGGRCGMKAFQMDAGSKDYKNASLPGAQ